MSRSIHENRRLLRKLREMDTANPGQAQEGIARVEGKLARKHAIKEQIRGERKNERNRPEEPDFRTAGEVPIVIRDAGPSVHYPVTAEDLRGVMSRLPQSVCDGLSQIVLCLGKQDQGRKKKGGEEGTLDPWTGRVGGEILPGIWEGRMLGRYRIRPAEIRLYAYVYPPDLEIQEPSQFIMRLQMLSTFVHEIAHHDDFCRRMGRGRWTGEDEDHTEKYAVEVQHAWIRLGVVPWLEETYPHEVKAFLDWVEHHGGLCATLAELVCGPEKLSDGQKAWSSLFGGIERCIIDLAADVWQGKSLTWTRIEFAHNLHMIEAYDMAMAIVERVMAEDPDYTPARVLKGDILNHLEQHDKACEIMLEVLAKKPENLNAWHELIFAYQGQKKWRQVGETILHVFSNFEECRKYSFLVRALIRAKIEMGDDAGAEEYIRVLEERGTLALKDAKAFREKIKARRAAELQKANEMNL